MNESVGFSTTPPFSLSLLGLSEIKEREGNVYLQQTHFMGVGGWGGGGGGSKRHNEADENIC